MHPWQHDLKFLLNAGCHDMLQEERDAAAPAVEADVLLGVGDGAARKQSALPLGDQGTGSPPLLSGKSLW